MICSQKVLLILSLSALICVGINLRAQSTDAPHAFYSGDKNERRQALLDLGVAKETSDEYQDVSTSMAGGIGWYPQTISGSKVIIMFLPCNDTTGATIALLTSVRDRWHVADQYVADCHYRDQVYIDLVPLINPSQNDILVHYDCDSHGTGYVEHRLHVLTIRGGKLQNKFETLEHLYASGWPRNSAQGSEELHFFIPIKKQNGRWALEDTKQLTPLKDDDSPQPSHRTVKRRVIRWSSKKGRFVASPFRPIATPVR